MSTILMFLVIVMVLVAGCCATIEPLDTTGGGSGGGGKKVFNNTINRLDGPLKKLIETGTIASPCDNNAAAKNAVEIANKPILAMPTVPIASHRNLFQAFHDRFYQQQQQQQQHLNYETNVQQPQQYAQQVANEPEPKLPFFYYFFTKRPLAQLYPDGGNVPTTAATTTSTTTPKPTTTATVTAAAATAAISNSLADPQQQTGSHNSVPLTANNFFNPFFHHQPVRYEPTMKFVLGVPMSTLDTTFATDQQLKNYYNRVPIDPHAYMPRPMRPRYMPIAATPYQPVYHMIRAVVLPDSSNDFESKPQPQQNS